MEMSIEQQTLYIMTNGVELLHDYFPGLNFPQENPFTIINLLLSKNPDSFIEAKIAADGPESVCTYDR